jgi:hypothetical protein
MRRGFRLSPKELDAIARDYHEGRSLDVVFAEFYDDPVPDNLNSNHRLLIVASELDDSTERIIQYLVDEYEANINAIFFTFFESQGDEFLGRAWLIDPDIVQEKSEARTQAPWSGFWFVNLGEGDGRHRRWEDNREYGFISAGQVDWYARGIKRLSKGDQCLLTWVDLVT